MTYRSKLSLIFTTFTILFFNVNALSFAQNNIQLCYYSDDPTYQNNDPSSQLNIEFYYEWSVPSYYESSTGLVLATRTGSYFLNVAPNSSSMGNYGVWASAEPIGITSGSHTNFTILSSGTGGVGAHPCKTISLGDVGPSSTAFTQPGIDTGSQQGLIVPIDSQGNEATTLNDGLQIWGIDVEGNGFLVVSLDSQDVSEIPTNPDTNLPIYLNPLLGVGFYVLQGGPLQVNFGPNSEGWVDVVIFSRDLEILDQHRWNVNDVLYPDN